MRTKWYARIRTWDGIRQTEKLIPLKTESKVEAHERLVQVNRVEKDIKDGVDFSFPWFNNNVELRIARVRVKEAVSQYLKSRSNDGLAESSIRRITISLNALMSVVSDSFPVALLTEKHLEKFKEAYKGKHTPEGININLRGTKTFLKWCVDRELLEKMPKVVMMKIPKSLPSYLTDSDWAELMKPGVLDDHFKRTFYFYRETGCRLSEPFYGVLEGNWLIIGAKYTKQKVEKEVYLTNELIKIWVDMKTRFDSTPYKPKNFIMRYSKEFLRACRQVGLNHHLHDLRHTFAVRRYLQTGDIFLVKNELGHASVTTTERYSKFSLKRLAHDFPSLSDCLEKNLKFLKSGIGDTVFRDTAVAL